MKLSLYKYIRKNLLKNFFPFIAVLFMISEIQALSPSSLLPNEKDSLTEEEDLKVTPFFYSLDNLFRSGWLSKHPGNKLVLINRHGESYSNIFSYVQTHDSYSPLTRKGEAQAKALSDFYAGRGLVFDAIFSSDMERAFQTAKAIERHSLTPIQKKPALREILVWPEAGMKIGKAKDLYPGVEESFYHDPESFQLGSLYSGKKATQDLREFFDSLSKSPCEKILVSSHGMIILLGLVTALEIDYRKYNAVIQKLGCSPNTGVTALSYDRTKKKWILLVHGDNSFLPPVLCEKTSGEDLKSERIRFNEIAAERFKKSSNPDKLPDYMPGTTLQTKMFKTAA